MPDFEEEDYHQNWQSVHRVSKGMIQSSMNGLNKLNINRLKNNKKLSFAAVPQTPIIKCNVIKLL